MFRPKVGIKFFSENLRFFLFLFKKCFFFFLVGLMVVADCGCGSGWFG